MEPQHHTEPRSSGTCWGCRWRHGQDISGPEPALEAHGRAGLPLTEDWPPSNECLTLGKKPP